MTRSWGGFGLWNLMKGHSRQIHLVLQLTFDFSMYSLTTQNPADRVAAYKYNIPIMDLLCLFYVVCCCLSIKKSAKLQSPLLS